MLAVIDPRMPSAARHALNKICEVVELPPFSALDKRVASHPDMLMFRLESMLFVCTDYYREASEAIKKIISKSGLELILTDDLLKSHYPYDVKFNVLYFKGGLVGNLAYISEEIKEAALHMNIPTASVKQGYTKCSSVALKDAVISADKGICDAVTTLGYDALQVSPKGVGLNGYDCGFIGGATGVYENNVFFCGDAKKHPDYNEILNFCSARGYEIISLSDAPLYDVGTILFF